MRGRKRPNPASVLSQGHEGPVNAVQFSDDSQFLYSAGYDGQIRYWRLANDEYLRSVVKNGWSVSVFVVDEARDIVAFGSSDGVMSVSRMSDQTELLRVGDERVPVLSIFYHADEGIFGVWQCQGAGASCRYQRLVGHS